MLGNQPARSIFIIMSVKLSPEEKSIHLKKFEEETKRRKLLIEKVISTHHSSDKTEYEQAVEELRDMDEEECEHGVRGDSIHPCPDCEDIIKQLFPEQFVACSNCKELFDTEDIYDEGMCDQCSYDFAKCPHGILRHGQYEFHMAFDCKECLLEWKDKDSNYSCKICNKPLTYTEHAEICHAFAPLAHYKCFFKE
jgi:hypothetical protein